MLTPRHLVRLSCLIIFGVSCVVIAPFKSLAGFSPTKTTGLFVVYLIWPIFCVTTYTFSQLLVFRALDDRWPLSDIIFGIAPVLQFGHMQRDQTLPRCLSFFTLCVLLNVMMVYKYWNSITVRVRCHFSIQLLSTLTYSPRQREDLEFSVGSKVAVWKSKISC